MGEARKSERAGASEWSQREAVRDRRSNAEVGHRELGRSSQSIEAHVARVAESLKHRPSRKSFPAGIEPTSKV